MPHVKGNKFKPKPAEQPAAPEQAAAAVVGGGSGGKKSKKQRRQEAAAVAAAAAADDVAIEAVVSGAASATINGQAAANSDGTGLPAKKKQRRSGSQQQVLALPAIPTVVASAPKPGAAPEVAAAAATSNWAALKAAMDAAKQQQDKEGPRPRWQRQRKAAVDGAVAAAGPGSKGLEPAIPANRPQSIGQDTAPTKVLAMDCEMVGVGPNGERSALARVCMVNSAGNVLLDRFVRPKEKVTDFRTRVSGVRPSNLRDAVPFDEVQRQVAELLKDRIVVGHAIGNDLDVLLLTHRRKDVRDTSKYPPLMKAQARSGKLKPRALRHVAAEELGLVIQEGEHSPVDDARAALYLYLKHRKEWERWVAAGGKQLEHPAVPKMLAAAAAQAGLVGGSRGSQAAARMSLEQLAKNASYMSDL